jgi:mannose-6-phosphate isomerase-like protein (cupin superfamily)
MKQTLGALAVAAFLAVAFAARAAGMMGTPTITPAASVKWTAGTGEMKGFQVAVMYGDPAKKGSQYAVRLKSPDGTYIPPHFHKDLELVTVISGTFNVGLGDVMDASKMTALGPGSFAALPGGVHHYGTTKGVTVVEIHGIGPETMVMVKAAK